MGGYAGERLGTKEGYDRGKLAFRSRSLAEAGLHAGQQTGLLKEGIDKFAGDTMDFFERNTRSLRPGGNSKDQGAQSSVGKYSTSAQAKGKSGKSGAKGSQLESRESRKITGKGKLYVRK